MTIEPGSIGSFLPQYITGDGTTTQFYVPLATFSESQVQVSRVPYGTNFPEVEIRNFVSGEGFTIEFQNPPAATEQFRVDAPLPFGQPFDLSSSGIYRGQLVEDALDRLALQAAKALESVEEQINPDRRAGYGALMPEFSATVQ